MGRRLELCDWCETHHFQEIPYPSQEPEFDPIEDRSYWDDHQSCQCWCVTDA